jgi:hypothetical protein
VAMAHGIGNGTDHWSIWMLAIDAACVATVLGALTVRLASTPRIQSVEQLTTVPQLERV